jgi:hypothetical protein
MRSTRRTVRRSTRKRTDVKGTACTKIIRVKSSLGSRPRSPYRRSVQNLAGTQLYAAGQGARKYHMALCPKALFPAGV